MDRAFIDACKKYRVPFARITIFIVFFWFGLLKVLNLSPAEPLVEELFTHTISFMNFPTFITAFGLLEMLIGILFLIPKATRVVIPILIFHIITTILPLFLLPSVTWSGPFVPTLTGQYIIKNIVIIAVAFGIAGSVQPLPKHPSKK